MSPRGARSSPTAGLGRYLPDVLTAEQAAQLLQISSKTVKRRAQLGEIPGRRVGNQWRFSRQALIDWLDPDGSCASPRRC